jgi:hypothetical protein
MISTQAGDWAIDPQSSIVFGPGIYMGLFLRIGCARMTRERARKVAEEFIVNEGRKVELALTLIDDLTIEEDFGWVFFYNTVEFCETGDELAGLAGNAPLIVDRQTGELHVTGTAQPIGDYIELYRRHRTCNPLSLGRKT